MVAPDKIKIHTHVKKLGKAMYFDVESKSICHNQRSLRYVVGGRL